MDPRRGVAMQREVPFLERVGRRLVGGVQEKHEEAPEA